MKKDKLRGLRQKAHMVKAIIQKCDVGLDKYFMNFVQKRVETICHVDACLIYEAKKLASVKNLTLSLKNWLVEVTLLEKNPHETHNKALEMRDSITRIYLAQQTTPSEDFFQKNMLESVIIRCLKNNGYKYQRFPKIKKGIIIEKPQQLNERILYLKKITQYREDGRKIFYLDERIITERKAATDNYDFQMPCSYCITLCNDEGIIVANDKVSWFFYDGASKFLIQFIESNLDSLPPNCVVVLGDKGYHKQHVLLLPTEFSSKKQMRDWLEYNEIDHDPNMHRAELYKLIDTHKCHSKVGYYVDDILKFNGYNVVRRPFHCQYLNHFNEYWYEVESFLREKHVKLQVSHVIGESMRQAGEKYTPALWKEKEKLMIKQEQRLLKEDLQVEEIVDRLCTMMKYDDDVINYYDLGDFKSPVMEIDYHFSKQVATELDLSKKYTLQPI